MIAKIGNASNSVVSGAAAKSNDAVEDGFRCIYPNVYKKENRHVVTDTKPDQNKLILFYWIGYAIDL